MNLIPGMTNLEKIKIENLEKEDEEVQVEKENIDLQEVQAAKEDVIQAFHIEIELEKGVEVVERESEARPGVEDQGIGLVKDINVKILIGRKKIF